MCRYLWRGGKGGGIERGSIESVVEVSRSFSDHANHSRAVPHDKIRLLLCLWQKFPQEDGMVIRRFHDLFLEAGISPRLCAVECRHVDIEEAQRAISHLFLSSRQIN